jgi:hypothetical protein
MLGLAGRTAADDALVERWDRPRRETFEMKDANAERVAEEIRSRYPVSFRLKATGLQRATFVARDVTSFEALDQFAALHGIHLAGVPESGGDRDSWETDLSLVRADPATTRTPVAYFGPSRFSVECASVLAVQRCAPALGVPEDQSFLDEEEMPRLRLRLRWLVEPGFEEAEIVEWTCAGAIDDLGGSCAPFPDELDLKDQAIPANGRFLVQLRPPRGGARKLAKVELTARIALPAAREEVTFDASEVGTTKNLGGARITFVKLEGTAAGFDTDGSLDGESGTRIVPASWGKPDMGNAVLRAYSESGAEIAATPVMSFPQQGVGLAQAPKRIVLSAVTKVAVRETTVTFTDVPLPP